MILACKRTFTEIQTKYSHLSRGLPRGMVTGQIEPCISESSSYLLAWALSNIQQLFTEVEVASPEIIEHKNDDF